MPLAEKTRGIPGCFEGLRQRDRIQAQALAPLDGMSHTAQKLMATTQEFRTTGRTPCTAVILCQEQALRLKVIDIGGLDDGIA